VVNLGLDVIAEGVETEGQRQFLESIGCHHFQGYLFSKPLPVADFDAYLARHSAATPANALT
jgi:EAL domain-containing protein (putative c-di-GMP-specific phosphodiesterase class I)